MEECKLLQILANSSVQSGCRPFIQSMHSLYTYYAFVPDADIQCTFSVFIFQLTDGWATEKNENKNIEKKANGNINYP